jgi:fatty acid desaturase
MKTKIKAALTTIAVLAALIGAVTVTVIFSYFVVLCLVGVMVCLGIYVIYMAALQHWDYKEKHGKKK